MSNTERGGSWEVKSHVLADEAMAWLEKHQKERFFVWAHFFDPHYNYNPLPVWEGRFGFRAGRCGRIRSGMDITELRDLEAALSSAEVDCVAGLHRDEVSFADHNLGRVLDALDRLGLAGRTLVAIVADHGEEFMERGHIGHEKTVHNELVRVPFMLGGGRLPRVLRVRGSVSTMLLHDAVVAAVTGAPFHGARPVVSRTFHGFFERGAQGEVPPDDFSWIEGNWKLVSTRKTNTLRLYDLAADPGERRPMTGHPRQGPMLERLAVWRAAHMLPPEMIQQELAPPDPAQVEQLRRLGYME